MKSFFFLLVAGLLAGAGLTGCKPKGAAAGAGAFAVPVVIIPAKAQALSEILALVGTVAANETVEVKAETDGIVKEIQFAEGQRVQKGDLLIALDDSKLAAELAEAEANYRLSATTYERLRQLLRDKLISQQDFEQAESAFAAKGAALDLKRRLLKDARVVAPFSGIVAPFSGVGASFNGVVGVRQISPGQVISRNTTLAWIVDLDTVKVEVSIPERYLDQIRIGQVVEFKVAAFPKEKFQGEVYTISPQLDASTRTALVKARTANPAAKLRGGMFANLELTLQLRDSAIVVPEPALVSNGDSVSVFVVDADNKAQVRPVKTGLRIARKVEILSGLAAGEKVVVEGVQKLYPGAQVTPSSAASAAPYLN